MARMTKLEDLQAELARIHDLAGNTCVFIEGRMTWGATAMHMEAKQGEVPELDALRAENARLLQLNLSTQRHADSLMEKLHEAERSHDSLRSRLLLLSSQLPSQYQGEITDMLGEG